MAFDKKKFVARFAGEAKDHIAMLNDAFLKLEKDPDNMEILNLVFRSAHTIKGSSRVLSLNDITNLAHKLEDTLDALRNKRISHSKQLFNLLFKSVDMLGSIIEQVQAGEAITIDTKQMCEELALATAGAPKPGGNEILQKLAPTNAEAKPSVEATSSATAKESPKNEKSAEPIVAPSHSESGEKPGSPAKSEETVRLTISKIDETIKLMGEIISNNSRIKLNLTHLDALKSVVSKLFEIGQDLESSDKYSSDPLIKEVVSMSQQLDVTTKQLEESTKDTLNMQTLLSGELRERVLKMRMFPLATVIDSFPRMVRDMCSTTGKAVSFIVDGAETELDKKVIEKIGDPLLHIVRNCFDHGIEHPEERTKKGKPEMGAIKLSAYYEGGNVLIEVSDDGGGIPIEKIKERAILKKLHDRETLDSMPEKEIINLIFRPGFSTSAIITDLSGRGVGMDVVKENIVEHLKGSIEIKTAEGKGSTFSIRIPVTLAIVRVLFVVISGFKAAIAVNSINEVLKVSRKDIIEVVNKRAIRLREQIIPVFNIETTLNLSEKKQIQKSPDVYIVMLSLGNEKLGLIVDSLINEEDIVMVPLPKHMEKIDLVAGVTLVGKDEIVVLFHIPKVFALSKRIYEEKSIDLSSEKEKKEQYILVVDDSLSTREIEKSILESYGYKVDLASDGMEGLEKAQEFHYDLVITDVEMPRMDGFSLTENLRKRNDYKHTPVIIVTSLDKESDKRRGIQVGANAYIVKGSFDQSNLLGTVQSLI